MRIACLALLVCALASSGCFTFTITPPEPSRLAYELPPDPPKRALTLVDERPNSARALPFVVFEASGNHAKEATPTNPARFLAHHTEAELVSRGLPVTIEVAETCAATCLHLRVFRVGGKETEVRVFVAADLERTRGHKRIAAFTTGGMVRRSLNEDASGPTVSQPLDLAVKEFASKLAAELYGYRSSDDTVLAIVRAIAPLRPSTYRNIYALGFTNDLRATDLVVRIAKNPGVLRSPDELMNFPLAGEAREAAAATLGNLHATGELLLLRSIYRGGEDSGAQCLAVKSIGDLDTMESRLLLDEVWEQVNGRGPIAQVIELYR